MLCSQLKHRQSCNEKIWPASTSRSRRRYEPHLHYVSAMDNRHNDFFSERDSVQLLMAQNTGENMTADPRELAQRILKTIFGPMQAPEHMSRNDGKALLDSVASILAAEMPRQISIEVYQQDWMPGFAAFLDDFSLQENGKAHVTLNLASFMATIEQGEIEKKDLPYVIAESLMHEVMHVLESWAGVEFSEDRVEALLTKYREKYAPDKPHYEVCESREQPEVTQYGVPSPPKERA